MPKKPRWRRPLNGSCSGPDGVAPARLSQPASQPATPAAVDPVAGFFDAMAAWRIFGRGVTTRPGAHRSRATGLALHFPEFSPRATRRPCPARWPLGGSAVPRAPSLGCGESGHERSGQERLSQGNPADGGRHGGHLTRFPRRAFESSNHPENSPRRRSTPTLPRRWTCRFAGRSR